MSTEIEQIQFNFSTDYTLKETESLSEREYTNTVRKNPNRRKITIINQTANTMEADIEFYPPDETEEEKDGTPITAEIMDNFHKVIAQADENAKSSFNMTNEIANRVANYLEQSNQNVINLEQQITESQGTKVMVNNNYVSEFIADEKLDVQALLDLTYPVGSIYISLDSTCPASIFGGNWAILESDKTLWTITSGTAGDVIDAGLPNIVGSITGVVTESSITENAISSTVEGTAYASGNGKQFRKISFDASEYNDIYGKSTTVQPPAIKVYMWKRTS